LLSKLPLKIGLIFVGLFAHSAINAEALKIGTVNVSPRGFIAEDNEVLGSSFELANAIAARAGYQFENSLLPYARILSYLKDGTVDLAVLVLNDRVNDVALPIAHIQNVDFILVGRIGNEIDGVDDLAGKNVGYLGNSVIVANMIKDTAVTAFQADNYESLVKMLMADRIDAIIGPRINVYWSLKQLNFGASDVNKPISLKKIKLYLVHSKKTITDSRRSELESAIAQLQESGAISDIIRNYDFSVQ
jgi:ABC-type amino acid transport substrate-binding protein